MTKVISSQLITETRETYIGLLKQSLHQTDFFSKVSAILDINPYFTPAQLEVIWKADEREDTYLGKKIQDLAFVRVREMAITSSLQEILKQHWTILESEALAELFEVLEESQLLGIKEKFLLKLYKRALRPLIQEVTESAVETPEYMIQKCTVDVAPLQQEITSLAPYWWQNSTTRRDTVSYHKDTWAFEIRRLAHYNVAYKAVDGKHESVATDISFRFPKIHSEILRLAEEFDIGLGKIAVVMMLPHSQSYRHFDLEEYYVGRNRYHLVLQCGEHNILSSGPDIVEAHEGEVWFFDNKAMHRAHNKSAVPRIHVIFDGYPLKSIQ